MKTHSKKPAHSVASQAMSGGFFILIGRLAIKAIDLVVLLVLARLLTQADFGLIGLAMTFVVILEAVLDVSLSQVLLKEKSVSKAMLDTVFTLGVIRGLILTFALCALAIPIAYAYGEPRLALLTCTLALAPSFRGACSPAMMHYIREMNFKWDILTELTGKIVGAVVCVCVALAIGSYWALVANVVVSPIALNLLSYRVAPYRPKFSLSQWHRFSNFTGWMTLSQFARALSWQLDKILLGMFLGPAVFGKYSVAKDLSNTSQQAIIPPMLKPLTSAFSKAHHDAADLGKLFIKSCSAILLIVGPIFLGLAILSDHVILIALGESWIEASWILRWFSIAAILAAVHRPVESMALMMEKNRDLALRRVVTTLIRLPMILIGCVFYSYQGAIAASVAAGVISFFLMAHLGCRLGNVKISKLLTELRSTAIALVVMGICLVQLAPDISSSDDLFLFILKTLVAGMLATTAYAISVLIFWRIDGSPSGLERLLVHKATSIIRFHTKTARVP